MAWAWPRRADSPWADRPYSGPDLRAEAVGGGAAQHLSTNRLRHWRAISARLASAGVGAALMRAMISSTLESATARPSRDVTPFAALRSSKMRW